MDNTTIAAIITAIAGLIAVFFGRHYWGLLNGMVNSERAELARLQMLVRELRDRLDELERLYYQKVTELEAALSQLDNQVTSAQLLRIENERLRTENQELKQQVNQLTEANDLLISQLGDLGNISVQPAP